MKNMGNNHIFTLSLSLSPLGVKWSKKAFKHVFHILAKFCH